MEAGTPSSKPTGLIIIAAVCAIAAIGLGIWAVTLKSDLDDANEKLDNASTGEVVEKAYAAAELQRYRVVRKRLARARTKDADLTAEVRAEVAKLRRARQATAAAKGQEAQTQAELKQAKAETRVAAACARGTIASINNFFAASNTKTGAKAAIDKLEEIEPDCQEVLK